MECIGTPCLGGGGVGGAFGFGHFWFGVWGLGFGGSCQSIIIFGQVDERGIHSAINKLGVKVHCASVSFEKLFHFFYLYNNWLILFYIFNDVLLYF